MDMLQSYEERKKLILECLGTPGFRDVFRDEVSIWQPLRWEGYKIAGFFNHDKRDFNVFSFLSAKLVQLARTFRFPKNPIHEAALYFYLQRWCVKDGYMYCCPESPADLSISPATSNDDSDTELCLGQWTLFYLMYLDSLTWRFPDGFKGCPHGEEEEETPRKKYIFEEVCRQLCGVRTESARIFHGRTGTEEEYRDICLHCAKQHWASRFYRAEKHPALVLALSFYANGYASFKTESNNKPDADTINAEYLYGLADHATNYRVFVPDEDWEARALFFILAQWLFLSGRRTAEPTLEEHIFAILYLRFYRQGTDDYFKRESMSAIWDGIPYDKKEDVAVYYRRLLAGTRTKAAELWPDARISDYPEVEEDGVAVGMVFQELVREGKCEKLDVLIREQARLLGSYWKRGLIWAASHSKKMYSYLKERQHLLGQSREESDADWDYSKIAEGWSKMPMADLGWSNETLRHLLSPEAYKTLIRYASLSMFEDVMPYGKPLRFARLKAYVEDLKLDINAGDTGEYAYNASHPILYKLMAYPRTGGCKAISYLLAHGANPNCGGHRCTCLGLAVAHNKLGLMKMLIDSGADVNLPSTTGRTPMEIAIEHKRAKAIEMLVKAGAKSIAVD